ncbi:MAG TPA: hypothetical protein VGY66_07960 [Gemmataceae bacterium]|jgi:hypothetical protein|nr:hypothetical protein [Gemmataceae bacterium]
MATTLTVRDETTDGKAVHEFAMDFLVERITVRELIRSRVYQEVQDYNLKQPQDFRSLVQPQDAERTGNGFRLRQPRQIDWKEQFARAVEAFDAGQVLVLVNDRQAERLDEVIEIKPGTVVSFLKLTMLVGG